MKNKIGIIIIVIGSLHLGLSFVKFSQVFTQMLSEGIFDSVVGAERGWALWFTFTGIVFILLGYAIKYMEQQNLAIPTPIGWLLLIASIFCGILLPLSGCWALLLPAILIIMNKSHQKVLS